MFVKIDFITFIS